MPRPERTPEEQAETKRLIDEVATARAAILKDCGNKKGTSGRIACTKCAAGKITYSVARNGHVWAACSTPDCICWME